MTYALIVAIVSIAGAAVPLRAKPGHASLQLYLSLAAGALLGAALFHLLPEAAELAPRHFGLATILGILAVFLLQRYVAPHSHEADAGHTHEHGHEHHDHDHAHDHAHGNDRALEPLTTAAPALHGLIPILALSFHSFFDGVAIGAATGTGMAAQSVGLSVFLSVLIHKPLDGLSVSVLLLNARTPKATLWVIQLVYAALVPLGAAAFHLTSGHISHENAVVGYTLAFSAGSFLSIALTDLLPELQFHSHDRNKLTFAMLLGIAVMFLTSLFE